MKPIAPLWAFVLKGSGLSFRVNIYHGWENVHFYAKIARMKPGELLQTLVRRTGLTEQHVHTLRSLEPIAGPLAPEVALAFYDYLGRDPEMHEILWGVPGRAERLY